LIPAIPAAPQSRLRRFDIRQQVRNQSASRLWRNRGVLRPEFRPASDVLSMLPESNIAKAGRAG
jgi:hypothetical protein